MVQPPLFAQERLVLKINEIYHDLENQAYSQKHPDILEDEIPRWQRRSLEVLSLPREPMHILDFGSGTGFVPLQLKEWLHPQDRFTCSDLSIIMLDSCKTNLVAAGLSCQLDYLKLDGNSIDLPDQSQDLVTLNAVLHHLPNPRALCAEVDRILKPGGRVLIGHEPTHESSQKKWLAWNYRFLLPIADPVQFGYEILLRLGLFEKLRRPLAQYIPKLAQHNLLLEKVNQRLLQEKIIPKPLDAATLSSLLDIQSPTAGGHHLERGFTHSDMARYFPGYFFETWETYNHLNKMQVTGLWLKRYNAWLAKKFPDSGTSFFCGLLKPYSHTQTV